MYAAMKMANRTQSVPGSCPIRKIVMPMDRLGNQGMRKLGMAQPEEWGLQGLEAGIIEGFCACTCQGYWSYCLSVRV